MQDRWSLRTGLRTTDLEHAGQGALRTPPDHSLASLPPQVPLVHFLVCPPTPTPSLGNDHLVMLTLGGDLFTSGCGEQGQLGRVPEFFANRGGRKGLCEYQWRIHQTSDHSSAQRPHSSAAHQVLN